MPLSILIADDHQLVRKGLQMVVKDVLGFHVRIEFAENGRQVMEKISETEFDMLITDLTMPDTNELALIPDILRIRPKLRILVVTMKPDKVFATRFFQAGALGYVNKNEPDEVLAEAVSVVSQGRRYISRSQGEIFSNALMGNVANTPFDKLSKREFEVALLLLKGYGALEVSNALHISASTASSFRCRVFDKLEIKNLLELNHLAQQYQIDADPEG
ncbi:DNA-binding response regulator [Dyadobacter beijingensis]|uniref:DNA-binding response regulator n=1 Tax=Dyadobacter beijingensis TaxID=365489 RepID=A0ABQ2ID79_9BACT|nr:response regulator transcription factor [Dyadobacter beijingensis]GGN04015.1 DNA-binding response regulator [Dyadobacter beijingensis]